MKAVKLSKRAKLLTTGISASEKKSIMKSAQVLYSAELISSSRFTGIMRWMERGSRKF